jgi:K(+)-stimulated pyrophosphate-energized sodium pump
VLITAVSLLSLAFAYFLWKEIKRSPLAEGERIEYFLTIKKGVLGFLRGQKKFCFSFSAIIFIILLFLGPSIALGFLFGVLIPLIAGYAVTIILSETSLKLAGAADQDLILAAKIALKGSWATALSLIGLILFFLAGLFSFTSDLRVLMAMGLGSTLVSILIKLNSNIYLEAINVKNDQENVRLDDTGKKAFLFYQIGKSFKNLGEMINLSVAIIISLVSAMFLGKLLFPFNPAAIVLPLFLISIAVLAVVISVSIVGLLKNKSINFVFYSFLILAWFLFTLGSWLIIPSFGRNLQISLASLGWPIFLGLAVVTTVIKIGFLTDKDGPFLAVGNQHAKWKEILLRITNLKHKALLPFVVALGLVVSYFTGGLYGLALGIVTIFSLLILIIFLFSHSLVVRNTISLIGTEGNKLSASELGKTNGASQKAVDFFLVNSTRLSVLLLFLAYFLELRNFGRPIGLLLGETKVWLGFFLGIVIIYCFIVLLKAALERTILTLKTKAEEELKESELDSNYQDCLGSLIRFDFKKMFWPVSSLVIIVIIVGFIFGASVLAGLLSGSIFTGMFLIVPFHWNKIVWENIEKNVKKINRQDRELSNERRGKDFYRWAICSAVGILNIVALLIVSLLNF